MPLKILVAGAGLGGVAAACSLLQAGFDVEVYEQSPQLAEVGAGIQLSANAMHVLKHIGLEERLSRLWVQPRAYVFRLHDTGEKVGEFSLAEAHQKQHGAPYCQFHRADLHDALAARARALKPDVIRLDHKAVGFAEHDDRVELTFSNGSRATGDLLIGADGVKSAIRAQMLGPDRPGYSGDSAWRLVVPTSRLPKNLAEQVMSVWMGPGKHVVTYLLRGGELLNFVGLVETDDISEESWIAKFPWEKLKEDFAGWHDTVQAVIDGADKDQCFRWSLYFRPPVDRWSTQRVTMLGDAVHATLPYLAQGACMAIEDGAILTRCLAMTSDIRAALTLYERNRIPRTSRIVNASSQNRTLFHSEDQDYLRQHFASRDEGRDRGAAIYSYNPLTVELV